MDVKRVTDLPVRPDGQYIKTVDKSRSLKENPYLNKNRQEKNKTEIIKGKPDIVVQIPERKDPVKITGARIIQKKIRVAGYCRVSTGSEQQETSIDAQRKHYESYIRSNPDWEFAGIYWEAEVSGTKKENRPELMRLIADCREGRVDLILTKSISRFSRNTTDCLEMVRTLTGLGVKILFEKENIHTGTMESELLLTLFSSFAEEESKSISANEKWSVRKRFENGTFRYSKAPYGYRLVDGTFEIDPEQAPVVKEIFEGILSGKGSHILARELNERGIPTGTTRRDGSQGVWTVSMILSMVKNVVYIGDVINQKTFSSGFRVMKNYGERQMYYNEGHHEAIIDAKTFEKANSEVSRRDREQGHRTYPDCQLRRSDPRNRTYAFTGKLRCACCGAGMKRETQYISSGKRYHWVCCDHLGHKGNCEMKRQNEIDIQNAFSTMVNKLRYAGDGILGIYVSMLTSEETEQNKAVFEKHEQEIKNILDEKNRLTLLISKGCGESVSYRMKLIELDARENALRNEIAQRREKSIAMQSVSDLKEALYASGKNEGIASLFTSIVREAEVMTGEYVVFQLQCGLSLTESLKK